MSDAIGRAFDYHRVKLERELLGMKLWDPERYQREALAMGDWLVAQGCTEDEFSFWWDFWDEIEVYFPEPE